MLVQVALVLLILPEHFYMYAR